MMKELEVKEQNALKKIKN